MYTCLYHDSIYTYYTYIYLNNEQIKFYSPVKVLLFTSIIKSRNILRQICPETEHLITHIIERTQVNALHILFSKKQDNHEFTMLQHANCKYRLHFASRRAYNCNQSLLSMPDKGFFIRRSKYISLSIYCTFLN